MANIISSNRDSKVISNEFSNNSGDKFTLSGYGLGSWYAALEKKMSNGEWIRVKYINNGKPIEVFELGGIFRVVKEKGIDCIVDKD